VLFGGGFGCGGGEIAIFGFGGCGFEDASCQGCEAWLHCLIRIERGGGAGAGAGAGEGGG